jgi:archaemetzincin
MKRLDLLAIGDCDRVILGRLGAGLSRSFGVECTVLAESLDPTPTFHREREQYHSSEILFAMQRSVRPDSWRVLGITMVDLYIPILTFVFGEAQMGGSCGLVSGHRLCQQFYGLPEDQALFERRLLTESIHELGHTLQLTHCDDYACAMAPSHGVEWMDLKLTSLCQACERRLASTVESLIFHNS